MRDRKEQFKYLETFLLEADGVRCTECRDVRHVDDCCERYDYQVCIECGVDLDKKMALERQHLREMRKEGLVGIFFGLFNKG